MEAAKGHQHANGGGLLAYGSMVDTKYAKTTLLSERNSEMTLNGGPQDNGLYMATTSTPLHSSSSGLVGVSNYLTNTHGSSFDLQQSGNATATAASLQQQHQYKQQPPMALSSSLRRASSRADIDLLERDTNLQMRVSDTHFSGILTPYFVEKSTPVQCHGLTRSRTTLRKENYLNFISNKYML